MSDPARDQDGGDVVGIDWVVIKWQDEGVAEDLIGIRGLRR